MADKKDFSLEGLLDEQAEIKESLQGEWLASQIVKVDEAALRKEAAANIKAKADEEYGKALATEMKRLSAAG